MACYSGFQKVSEATRKARETRSKMSELLITRVQDVKVLETTVKELNDECEACAETEIPSEIDAISKASNNVINNTDFNFATRAATKRIK